LAALVEEKPAAAASNSGPLLDTQPIAAVAVVSVVVVVHLILIILIKVCRIKSLI